MALILHSFFLCSYNFSYLEHSVLVPLTTSLCISFPAHLQGCPFLFWKNLFLRFKLEITSFYLWAHAGRTKSIIKRCQTLVNNCSSLFNTQCNKPCIIAYATKRGGEVAGGGGVGSLPSGPGWKLSHALKGNMSKGNSFSPSPSPPPPPKKDTRKNSCDTLWWSYCSLKGKVQQIYSS